MTGSAALQVINALIHTSSIHLILPVYSIVTTIATLRRFPMKKEKNVQDLFPVTHAKAQM